MGFEPTTFCMASLPPRALVQGWGFRLGERFGLSARGGIRQDSGSICWVWAPGAVRYPMLSALLPQPGGFNPTQRIRREAAARTPTATKPPARMNRKVAVPTQETTNIP